MPAPTTSAVATTDQDQAVMVVKGTERQMKDIITSSFHGRAQADDLARALAGRYPPEYFLNVAVTQFTRSPALWGASMASVYRAIIEAAQMGLPFLAGRAYLVPMRRGSVQEAQLIVGYQGLVDLVSRGGQVAYLDGAVVRQRDHFRYVRGTSPMLEHIDFRPTDPADADPGPMTHVWAMAKFRGEDQPKFDVMTYAEIEVIRKRAPSASARTSPWTTDYFEMAKKTVLRRLCKTLPLGLEVMEALDREDQREQAATSATQVDDATSQVRARLQARVAPQLAQPAADSTADPIGATQADVGAQAADDAGPDPIPVAPGQETLPLDDAPPPEPPHPTPARCGAVVMDGSEEVQCLLRPGHRGDHSDGTRDWPRK